jgi:acetyl-CoA acetyltransferase
MNPQLAGRVAVAGVGTTRYGKLPEYDAYDLGVWALKSALEDCGLGFGDVDGLIINRIADYQRFGEITGINPRYTTITPGQGRFSGICIQTAVAVIAAGMAEVVALVYGNNGRSAGDHYGGASDAYGSGGAGLWFPYGMTSPGAFHALMMRRHMEEYGTTTEQLGAIARAFRRHASLNPQAVMRTPFTPEEYRAARFICEPLRLLDYCLINDGGVAMILTSAERARDLRKPAVYVRGFSQASALTGSTFPPDDYWRAPMARVAADVYQMAGAGPADMDALMIYDNFTPTVLFSLEGFGFCRPGESGPWVADGKLELGDEFPTNTSGGHLSESYMQGWALNVEAVRQVRGECGARQVAGANLVQYMTAAPVITSIIYGSEATAA